MDLLNPYGGSELTREFFANELINDMKEVNDDDIDYEFNMTEKKRLEEISTELPNVIHKPYDYYEYAEMDRSNERFIRKQENTNLLKDDIFAVNNNDNEEEIDKNTDQYDLFGNEI